MKAKPMTDRPREHWAYYPKTFDHADGRRSVWVFPTNGENPNRALCMGFDVDAGARAEAWCWVATGSYPLVTHDHLAALRVSDLRRLHLRLRLDAGELMPAVSAGHINATRRLIARELESRLSVCQSA